MAKYFTPQELACKHCGEVIVSEELLTLLDKIRVEFGYPLRVTSGYRCKAHNEAVGGVKGSLHTLGLAADLQPVEGDLEALRGICDRLNPAGGVGMTYKTFVHVDVRGRKARW